MTPSHDADGALQRSRRPSTMDRCGAMQGLTAIVTDRDRAWQAADLDPERLEVALSGAALEELERHRDALRKAPEDFSDTSHALDRLPVTVEEMQRLRDTHLDRGCGLVVIAGSSLARFTDRERKNIHWVLCSALGAVVGQDERGTKFAAVKDTGQRTAAGGRYHQSNEGGVLHTDGPQYESPPDYVGLLCVNPACEGGQGRAISAYTVHNALVSEHPELVPVLHRAFHFERRGATLPTTTSAPIFAYEGEDGFRFRYLGSYIRSGHALAKRTLSPEQRSALAVVEELLARPRFVVSVPLAKADIWFFDNRRLAHGRTEFHDDPHGRMPPREMGRVWIGALRAMSPLFSAAC
jgi:alpha-ketoglutarate-dependent taurine dioxygenase